MRERKKGGRGRKKKNEKKNEKKKKKKTEMTKQEPRTEDIATAHANLLMMQLPNLL